MANNVQFSIAVHILAGAGLSGAIRTRGPATLAASVNTSPSFVRRTLAKLSKAGLVETATGKAGACWLARSAKDISLLDVYHGPWTRPRLFLSIVMPSKKFARLAATSRPRSKRR
jgi:DNA-binding IscR family transcriptional regulator